MPKESSRGKARQDRRTGSGPLSEGGNLSESKLTLLIRQC